VIPDQHKNFAYSTVATAPAPASSGTSLVVAAGDGVKFPTPPFNATVWPPNTLPITSNAEIVRCTALATDTLTISRTQEGSSARAISIGDQLAATITAKTLADAEDLVYDGNFSAGPTYSDGEIVVYNGIAYLCVKPTSAAPVAWPGGPTPAPLPTPAYGTSLPISPLDGQEAILVDSLTNPTYQWRFRYNAGSSSAYKWEFVGGSRVFVSVPTVETLASATTWSDLATVGPRFIVPRGGDYTVQAGCTGTHGAAGTFIIAGIAVGASDPGSYNQLATICISNAWAAVSMESLNGVVMGNDVRLRYYASAANAQFQKRYLSVLPVRVA